MAMACMKMPVSWRSVMPGVRADSVSCRARSAMRTASPDRLHFVRRLYSPDPAQHWFSVDQLGGRKGLGQQICGGSAQAVGGHGASRCCARNLPQGFDEVASVERDPVEVLVRDVVGDTFVPRAQQIDRPGGPLEDASGSERTGSRCPQPRRSRHVAGISLAPEHEHVDALCLHFGQHAGVGASGGGRRHREEFRLRSRRAQKGS